MFMVNFFPWFLRVDATKVAYAEQSTGGSNSGIRESINVLFNDIFASINIV